MNKFLAFLLVASFGIAKAQSSLDENDPMMASIIFYSQKYAIERLQGWCEKEHPASSQRINAAREEWDRLHEPLWATVPDILQTNLSREDRLSIAVNARRENDRIISKLASAPRDERIKWCDEAPERILSDQLSLMNRPDLVQAIVDY